MATISALFSSSFFPLSILHAALSYPKNKIRPLNKFRPIEVPLCVVADMCRGEIPFVSMGG